MDFKGQQLSERLSQFMILAFAAVAFGLGYTLNSFSVMITTFGSGVGIAFIATVLDWPLYNKNQVAWRKPSQQPGKGSGVGRRVAVKKSKAGASNFWQLFR